jgi:uncharacterized protein YjbI with pentapeptide repeats
MLHRKTGTRTLSTIVGVGVMCGGLVAVGIAATGSAHAATTVTCPTVASDGTVTPAPTAGVNWSGCNLTSANLSGATLTGSDLYQAILSGANLSGANLSGAYLFRANLSGTNLSGANLSGAILRYGNLTGVNLSDANLTSAYLDPSTLTGANISGATLTGAVLTAVTSGGITGTPASGLPANWQLEDGYLIGPAAKLEGVDLSGFDLSGADLENADLDDTNLSGLNLSGANLSRAGITGANVSGTAFSGVASFTWLRTGGLTGTPASLPSASDVLENGYIIGQGLNLYGASINGLDLSGMDLSGANMNSVDLAGSNLTGASLAGDTAENANLSGAILQNADLAKAEFDQATMSGADLQGADLDGSFLIGATLANANLASANLDDTFMEEANLTGATTTGVTSTGANWGNTTCPDGVNSNAYVDGCFSALDTTPPTVTVTGVKNGALYVQGTAPAVGCTTTDNGTVETTATLSIKRSASGFQFTATCSGAVDLAGNKAAPVSVTYTVAPGMHGFVAPGNGATIARSAGSFVVRFKLTNSAGVLYSTQEQSAMAADNEIRMMLSGPGISSVRVRCSWVESQLNMSCTIRIPSTVKTGSGESYELTAGENLGAGYIAVPAVGGTVDPEVIHFK